MVKSIEDPLGGASPTPRYPCRYCCTIYKTNAEIKACMKKHGINKLHRCSNCSGEINSAHAKAEHEKLHQQKNMVAMNARKGLKQQSV